MVLVYVYMCSLCCVSGMGVVCECVGLWVGCMYVYVGVGVCMCEWYRLYVWYGCVCV